MSFESLFSASKNSVYIIAEIGGNFRTYEEGKRLIDAAKDAGVDCVKFQTYRADTITSKKVLFDMENTGKISQYDYFKKYEISEDLHRKLFDYAESMGLDWFSTPSHQTDVDMLESLGVKAYKIGADDATNIPLLRYVARKAKPVFLSTGMCTLEEVGDAVSAIRSEGNKRIVVLHTVSAYPTYPEMVNLNALKTLQKEFPESPIGFSDHTTSTLACIVASAMGAQVIERHFTLDKKDSGPDHILSSTPNEMKYIVESIRTIEKMMGTGIKMPAVVEEKNRINNRKSVVAIDDIRAGEYFSSKNISLKRPGIGIGPKYYDELLNKKAKKDIKKDEVVVWGDIEA